MGPSITPYTRKLARKSHCKSRLGCQNCKRRRVKISCFALLLVSKTTELTEPVSVR